MAWYTIKVSTDSCRLFSVLRLQESLGRPTRTVWSSRSSSSQLRIYALMLKIGAHHRRCLCILHVVISSDPLCYCTSVPCDTYAQPACNPAGNDRKCCVLLTEMQQKCPKANMGICIQGNGGRGRSASGSYRKEIIAERSKKDGRIDML